jgi:molecular chaperone DnaJ
VADVFISYSRADAGFVSELVPVLAEAGLTVWWDRNIVGGTEFHKVIENEINAAGKVVVLWSKTSVDSVWVRDEAGLARDQGKLVPLAIDDCAIPLGFRSIHTLRATTVETIANDLLIACGGTPRANSEALRAAEPIERTDQEQASDGGPTSTGTRTPPEESGTGPGAGAAKSGGISDELGGLFSDFFGQKPAAKTGPARGSDLRYNYSLSLEEAFTGKVAEILVPTKKICKACSGNGAKPGASISTCPTCNGDGKAHPTQGFVSPDKSCSTCQGLGQVSDDVCDGCQGAGRITVKRRLSVNVPAGVEKGTRIRLAGEGEAGLRGGETGDLYLFLDVTPHEFFQRNGDDLTCQVPVPMTLAALGGQIEIPLIEGGLVRVRVPAAMRTGQSLRLKGRGMTKLRSEARGDLLVRTEVETPQKLGPTARNLMLELRGLRPTSDSRNAQLAVEERGPDLTCEITISVFEAALGGDVTFSIRGGSTLRMRVPEGVQNGQLIRLRGLGKEGGDLYVAVKTELPEDLTGPERELLRELHDLDGEVTNTESQGFVDRVREYS